MSRKNRFSIRVPWYTEIFSQGSKGTVFSETPKGSSILPVLSSFNGWHQGRFDTKTLRSGSGNGKVFCRRERWVHSSEVSSRKTIGPVPGTSRRTDFQGPLRLSLYTGHHLPSHFSHEVWTPSFVSEVKPRLPDQSPKGWKKVVVWGITFILEWDLGLYILSMFPSTRQTPV